MKRSLAALLGLSLLANAGLLAAVLLGRGRALPPPTSAAAVAPPAPVSPPPVIAPPVPPTTVWDGLHSDDPSVFAERLRGAGIPARTARLLVAADLRERYLERQRVLIGRAEPADFWKDTAAAADREKQAELRSLARAHEDRLHELFGPDDSAADNRERLRRQFGPLSDEKLAQLERIHADYGEIAGDIRAQASGLLLSADRETLALLELEKRKDVAMLLSPAELDTYDLLNAPEARALRARLAAFAPTEKEFRALYALQREFDERHAVEPNGASDVTRQTERAAAAAAFAARLGEALGSDRYEQYRRLQDPGYRVAARIAERYGLPSRRAVEVFAVARDAQARLQSLRSGPAATPDAVRQSLVALGRDSAEKLRALLGPEGEELYRRTSGGAWLRAIERAAANETELPLAAPNPAVAPGVAVPAPTSAPAS